MKKERRWAALDLSPSWVRGEGAQAHWNTFYAHDPQRISRPPGSLAARWAPIVADEARGGDIPSQVLDAGCGLGQDAAPFTAEGLEVIAVDWAAGALAAGREATNRVQFLRADLAGRLPFADEVFGAVHSRCVLSCIASVQRQRAMATELVRVLAPGGKLLITVRSTDDLLYQRAGQPADGHVRCGGVSLTHFSKRRLRQLFAALPCEQVEGPFLAREAEQSLLCAVYSRGMST